MTGTRLLARFSSDGPEQTASLGRALGACLRGGMTVGLVGDLGSGKTLFTKGIAVGNGLSDDREVTSPTFTLVNEYPGRLRLFHIDTYRLPNPEALVALGLEEMLSRESAVVIEWADRAASVLPEDVLWITFEPAGESRRRMAAKSTGPASDACLHEWRNTAGRPAD